ncbi:MAG: hypothetical protein QM579_03480 [Desulfovibrio sp.]|uniref:hypothetical protein n=1 Tax=Desulfovibrio sp. TaxID=885 RepID=UPI0039E2A8AF
MKAEMCCVVAWQTCQKIKPGRRKQIVPQQGRYAAYFLTGYFKTATMASKGRKFGSMKTQKTQAGCSMRVAAAFQ